ncbi:MAG: hypothetical protein ABSA75_06985 [Candidatus Bathyarchaeia archaeon]|jgi:hypothetical protein
MILSQIKSKLVVYGTLWAIGTTLLVLDYLSPFQASISNAQFWVGILFCMIPALFLLLDNTFSWRVKAFVLFIWGSTLYLPNVLRSPYFFNFQDAIYHFQTLQLIYQTHTLAINSTVPQISISYPGLELLGVALKSVTGLPLFSTAILLIGLVHSLEPVLIFLIIKRITSSDRVAAIGGFIFTCNLSYIFFDSLFSYESLGILFVIILVFLVSEIFKAEKRWRAPSRTFLLLSLVVLSGLVITHHFSAYMFLIFLAVLVIVQFSENFISKKRVAEKSFIYFLLLAATIVFAWQIYGAPITFEYLHGILANYINSFLKFFAPGGSGQRALFVHSSLPNYEIFIDYLYFPLILLLSGIGVYFVHKSKIRNTMIYILILYGSLIILVLPFILIGNPEIAYRSMPFLFIGLSLVIAYAVNGMIRQRNLLVKVIALTLVILIAIGGISIYSDSSGRFAGSSNLASGPAAVTSDVISASNWFAQEFGRYNNIVGDITVYIVFGGYGVQNVATYDAWNVFYPTTMNATVTQTLATLNTKYIIVDIRITEYLAKYGYYFDSSELNVKNLPNYGVTEPLPVESIDKFDNTTLLNKIYSNGNINIYRINP